MPGQWDDGEELLGQYTSSQAPDTRPTIDPGSAASPLLFKVGDQVRITDVSFRNDSVRFKIASLETTVQGEIAFQFPRQLEQDFPQRGNFDVALEATLTEGLSYTDIDSAKEEFITSQFDQFVQQLARSNTGIEPVAQCQCSA